MALHDIRKSYSASQLDEDKMLPNPIEQFDQWLKDAFDAKILEPTAMVLATADAAGHPAARMVLLKGVQDNGFIFYSNYGSHKGRDLQENPQAALLFYWDKLERQVRIEGSVTRLSREASAAYFSSRPYGSQVAAAASRQSTVLANRAALEAQFEELAERYPEGSLSLPEDWGGYALSAELLEFWQGRPNRMHDRLQYRKTPQGWLLERLAP